MKCVKCHNELLTGDIHWESGLCNTCWNDAFNRPKDAPSVTIDKFYFDLILETSKRIEQKEKQLAIYKKALELACKNISCLDADGFNCNEVSEYMKKPEHRNCIKCARDCMYEKHLSRYFVYKAKERLND